jgi:hypothetical protein
LSRPIIADTSGSSRQLTESLFGAAINGTFTTKSADTYRLSPGIYGSAEAALTEI